MYAELLMLTELHKAGSLSSKTMNFVIGGRENCWAGQGWGQWLMVH